MVHKWGHKWVVLAVLVKLPFASRAWALPVLVALARPQELDEREGRRVHRTPADLGRGLLATMLHWFPDRRFICLGDWGFGSHDLAALARRHRRRLTLIARCRADTNLFALVSGCGGWYRPAGRTRRGRSALVPLRWVCSRDAIGGRTDYFYSTDPTMTPEQIVELYAGRWAIEVTFAEARAHLGLETTRVRTRPSVERAAPCLFGLFSVVALIYAELVKGRKAAPAVGGTAR